MPPSNVIARSAIIHSGLFSETITTLSPDLMPWAFKPLENPLTFSDVSSQLRLFHSLFIFEKRNGLSAFSFARSKKISFKD